MEKIYGKINELSFCIEAIGYDDGLQKTKFNAFYYIVDGKRLDFGDDYQPASKYEILEDEKDYCDEKYKMVILNCCSCASGIVIAMLRKSWKKKTESNGSFID